MTGWGPNEELFDKTFVFFFFVRDVVAKIVSTVCSSSARGRSEATAAGTAPPMDVLCGFGCFRHTNGWGLHYPAAS